MNLLFELIRAHFWAMWFLTIILAALLAALAEDCIKAVVALVLPATRTKPDTNFFAPCPSGNPAESGKPSPSCHETRPVKEKNDT